MGVTFSRRINPHMLLILLALAKHGDRNAGWLMAFTGLGAGRTFRSLNKLAEDGLAWGFWHDDGKRPTRIYTLTDKGLAYLESCETKANGEEVA